MNLFDKLAAAPEEVARMPRPEREERVRLLVAEAHEFLDYALLKLVGGRPLAGIVILFSGGNDSTVLAHLMRRRASHAAHANTGVGVEQTRQFVRDVCAAWDLPLIERAAPDPSDSYRAFVLAHGFPGPGQHYRMYQRLKERALREVQRELVTRGQCVVFLAGRRRTESDRRALVPEMERKGSVVWCSPLVNWTKPDLSMYRRMQGDVPLNTVSDLIHMSGECLCGSFAYGNERREIANFFPEPFLEIARLEDEIRDSTTIPAYAKVWGWGADPVVLAASRQKRPKKSGILCSGCDSRQALLFPEEAAS